MRKFIGNAEGDLGHVYKEPINKAVHNILVWNEEWSKWKMLMERCHQGNLGVAFKGSDKQNYEKKEWLLN